MTRILIAAAATVAFAGVALAQEAPIHVGNYGPAVTQSLDENGHAISTAPQVSAGIDYSTTAAVNNQARYATGNSNAEQSTVPTFAHR